MSTADSVAKRIFGELKSRIETIATPDYRTDPTVYVGRSALHRLNSADETAFPAIILTVGPWERTQTSPKRDNVITVNVDAVAAASNNMDTLFDLLADVEEVVESVSDPYMNTGDGNLLRDAALIVGPVLNPPEIGGSLDVLSCGVELRFPTTIGDPTDVI